MNTTQVMHKFAPHDIVILKAHHKLQQQSKDNGEPMRLAVVAMQAQLVDSIASVAYYCRILRRLPTSWRCLTAEVGEQDYYPGTVSDVGLSLIDEAELMLYEGDE